MRDPPADWFIAAEHGWTTPDEAKGESKPVDTKWQQALDNTMNIGQALGLPPLAKSG